MRSISSGSGCRPRGDRRCEVVRRTTDRPEMMLVFWLGVAAGLAVALFVVALS